MANERKYQLILAIVKHIEGNIDWAAVAREVGATTGKTTRERAQRFLKKEAPNVKIVGPMITDGRPSTISRTRTTRAARAAPKEPTTSAKRKAEDSDIDEDEDDDDDESADVDITPPRKKARRVAKEPEEEETEEADDQASEEVETEDK